VERIAVLGEIGASLLISVSAACPGGMSPTNYAALFRGSIKLVASVKVTDMLKFVEPPIAAISVRKAFF
jgi:hypothetical protein